MKISNILVLVGIVLMLISALIWFLRSKKHKADADICEVTILMPSKGIPQIIWKAQGSLSDWRMMKLATLYIAKIGYVLNSGDGMVREKFRSSLFFLLTDDAGDFVSRLDGFAEGVVQIMADYEGQVSDEVFTITMYETFVEDSIKNSLPFRGVAENVPMSVILLMNDVVQKLKEAESAMIFESCIAHLVQEMYSLQKFNLTDLRRLFMSVKLSYEGVADLTQGKQPLLPAL